MPELTQAELKERVSYDPATGLFRWLTPVKHARYKTGDVAGSLHKSTGYWRIWINGQEYLGHRLAWLYMTGSWPDGDLDHKNTVRCENWWDNLRPATVKQNRANCPPKFDNPHGIKGITEVRGRNLRRPYRATIQIDGSCVSLGYFESPELAGEAYAASAKELYGDFAFNK